MTSLEAAGAPLRDARIVAGPVPGDSGAGIALASHGAVASFLGIVRDHSKGRAVAGLRYECYRPMAEKVLVQLIAETAGRFDPGMAAAVAHGTGEMVPGQAALSIHVASAHRAAAFDACRHLIERIKHDLPVWKLERYADGTQAWLKGS